MIKLKRTLELTQTKLLTRLNITDPGLFINLTSSGNSSLTSDKISDVFPTWAAHKSIETN